MSMYYASFTYLNRNSVDEGWVITHFEGDSGEMDTFLSTSTVGTDNYNGTKRTMYGSKYNNETTIKITVIKRDGTDFGITDTRDALSWLTGAQQNSWMYLYVGDENRDDEKDNGIGTSARFRVLGHVQDVKQYKMDARVVGLVIYFESASPWAYSLPQVAPKPNPLSIERGQYITGSETIPIDNGSDDQYTYTPVNVYFKVGTSGTLRITNTSTGEPATEVTGLSSGEVITMTDNMMITSDKPHKTFGNSFNFHFPRLKSGENLLLVEAYGYIEFTYSYCIKLGDCVTKINAASAPICNDEGKIIIETLDWGRIENTPKTLREYGLSGDAYTKTEVDAKIANIAEPRVDWADVQLKPTTRDGYKIDDVYTKTEVEGRLDDYEKLIISTNSDIVETKNELSASITNTKKDLLQAINDAVANLEIDKTTLENRLKNILK